ncbi:hypothetical protein HDU79_001520 [Rhizoclosmatium sp. JEL0117]|nr:hypothetical protein HDU79_001520 [Rhizoclosmatium sp. JEL0117]
MQGNPDDTPSAQPSHSQSQSLSLVKEGETKDNDSMSIDSGHIDNDNFSDFSDFNDNNANDDDQVDQVDQVGDAADEEYFEELGYKRLDDNDNFDIEDDDNNDDDTSNDTLPPPPPVLLVKQDDLIGQDDLNAISNFMRSFSLPDSATPGNFVLSSLPVLIVESPM